MNSFKWYRKWKGGYWILWTYSNGFDDMWARYTGCSFPNLDKLEMVKKIEDYTTTV